MKRAAEFESMEEILNSDNEQPHSKVMLVEREPKPGGIRLVNPIGVAKKSYIDFMELSEGVSNVATSLQANTKNKLDIIGRQMKNLHELMTDVFEDTKLSVELHSVACNFVKRPGHIYHLYVRPSGQKYFGMLSPDEWQNAPHPYLGSYMLEADQSWTPANQIHHRYSGIDYLKGMFSITQGSSGVLT